MGSRSRHERNNARARRAKARAEAKSVLRALAEDRSYWTYSADEGFVPTTPNFNGFTIPMLPYTEVRYRTTHAPPRNTGFQPKPRKR